MKDEQLEDALQEGYKQLNAVMEQLEDSCLAFNLPKAVTLEFTFEEEKREFGMVRLSSRGWAIGVKFPAEKQHQWKHISECKYQLKIEVAKLIPELRMKIRKEAENFLPELLDTVQLLKGLL